MICLLFCIGKGSLLLKKDVKSPYSVPESCENTNKMVSELIAAMKSTLKDVKMSYEFCQKEFEQNKDCMVSSFLFVISLTSFLNHTYAVVCT